MSFADTTAKGQNEAITFEFDLPHKPEKVWRALTDPELLAEWLLPAIGFELEPGKAFTLRAPQAYPGWDGIVNCRFVEIEHLRKITYTWTVPFLDTVVTFTLTPVASGTRLSIVQSGFKPDQNQEFGGARYGWRLMGGKLVDLLERIP
jgi:uncharacterized protein YndB with AHSA1/START domain